MEASYEKGLNRVCLYIDVEKEYEEDYQMVMMRKNEIPGLLKVTGYGIEATSRYIYEVTGLVSMAVLFENKTIAKQDIESLIAGILETLEELKKHMLNPGGLVLDPEYIFCKKRKYFFCYLPCAGAELCESFHRITEYFVKKLDYEDEEGIELASELHRATMQDNFDLKQIMEEYRVNHGYVEESEYAETEQHAEGYREAVDAEKIMYGENLDSDMAYTSDMTFVLDEEPDTKPKEYEKYIREGGVWTAWKKAAHKISRGKIGKWGNWDDLILETDRQQEKSRL